MNELLTTIEDRFQAAKSYAKAVIEDKAVNEDVEESDKSIPVADLYARFKYNEDVRLETKLKILECVRAMQDVENAARRDAEIELLREKDAANTSLIQLLMKQSKMELVMEKTRADLLRSEGKLNLRGMLETIHHEACKLYGNTNTNISKEAAYSLLFKHERSLLDKAKQTAIARKPIQNDVEAGKALYIIYDDFCRKIHGTKSAEAYQRDKDFVAIPRPLLSHAQADFLWDLGKAFGFPVEIVD